MKSSPLTLPWNNAFHAEAAFFVLTDNKSIEGELHAIIV